MLVLRPHCTGRQFELRIAEMADPDADMVRPQIGQPIHRAAAFRTEVIGDAAVRALDVPHEDLRGSRQLHGLATEIRANAERATRPALAGKTVADADAARFAMNFNAQLAAATRSYSP